MMGVKETLDLEIKFIIPGVFHTSFVNFRKYCETCSHNKLDKSEEPCNGCLRFKYEVSFRDDPKTNEAVPRYYAKSLNDIK